MPDSTRPLQAARNPARRMQELLRQTAPPPEEAGTQESTEVSTQMSTQTKDSSGTAQETAGTPGGPAAGLKARLAARAGREPTVRFSIDMGESLHARMRRYCADHHLPSARYLVLCLLEDFLEGEGYGAVPHPEINA